MRITITGVVLAAGLLLAACTGVPANLAPVDGFQAERYLGRWYEIARLDHSFERGLSQVTAEYSKRDDGGITVVNRGWSAAEGRWKSVEGRAYFVDSPDRGHLKVSFFGPFYGSYVVFDLDREGYRYALVSGPTRSWLWILAREPKIPEAVMSRLVAEAAAQGFDVSGLVRVEHR